MADKQQIVSAIKQMAKRLGRAPMRWEFVSDTGIGECAIARYFVDWKEALKAAWLHPYIPFVRTEDGELLKDWGEAVRKKGGAPAHLVYRQYGKYHASTLVKRFGRWATMPKVFREFAKGKPEWADVLKLLPEEGTRSDAGKERERQRRRSKNSVFPVSQCKRACARLRGRPAYGNPTPFRWLRHEPVNEQGVVLLFGMLAKELGYMIESVQKNFPDCEAKRQIGPERWQRVNIEFEFESKNFREHGHPAQGCDVIVCWRDNWEDRPRSIEVLELSSVIETLGKAEQ